MRFRAGASRIWIVATLLLLAGMAGYFTVTSFFKYLSHYPGEQLQCFQPLAASPLERKTGSPPSEEFSKCVKDNATLFISHDYPEIRDHAKAFLTLISAVFVASIAFSEKIVNISTAGWWSRSLIVLCWASLFSSLVAVGTGLVGLTGAYWLAVHEPLTSYESIALTAYSLLFSSGILFGAGLALMLLSAMTSFLERQHNAQQQVAVGRPRLRRGRP